MGMHRRVLANGIASYLYRDPSAKNVRLHICARQAEATEPEGLEGITHYLEHCVFRDKTLRKTLSRAHKWGTKGVDTNGSTTSDDMNVTIDGPTGYQLYLFQQARDLLEVDTWGVGQLEPEKNVVLTELDMLVNNPAVRAEETVSLNLYGATPYTQTIAQQRDALGEINEGDLLRHRDAIFRTDNLVIFVTSPEEIRVTLRDLNSTIGTLAFPTGFQPLEVSLPPKRRGYFVDEDSFAFTNAVNHSFRAGVVPTEEFLDQYARLRVLESMLGVFEFSETYTGMRVRDGKFYRATAGVTRFFPEPVFFIDYTVREKDQVLGVAGEISAAIDRLAEEPLTRSQLAAHKNTTLQRMRMNLDDHDERMEFHLRMMQRGLDVTFSEFAAAIRRIGPQDIMSAAGALRETQVVSIFYKPDVTPDYRPKRITGGYT